MKSLASLANTDQYWYCSSCKDLFPFGKITDDEFLFINNKEFESEQLYQLNKRCYEFSEYETFKDSRCGLESIDPDVNFFSKLDYKCEYITHDRFAGKFSNENGIAILHLNCRSIDTCFDEIVCLVDDMKVTPDIITISESWLNDSSTVENYSLENYQVFITNRVNKRAGGVMIYCHVKFNGKLLVNACCAVNNLFECVTVELIVKTGKNIIVMCVYRKPGGNIVEFSSCLKDLLSGINTRKNLFICGDFNIDLLVCEVHNDSKGFLDMMYSFGLYPLINKPTRVTADTATLIDNIYTNMLVKSRNAIIVCDSISDHMPVFTMINSSHGNISKGDAVKYFRDNSRPNMEKFQAALSTQEWDSVCADDDANTAYTRFITQVTDHYNTCCPMKKATNNKTTTKPWITRGLQLACRKKRRLYCEMINNRSQSNVEKYKRYKNKLTTILRHAQKLYYNQLLEQHSSNIKKTWNVLNTIIKRNQSVGTVHDTFTDDNNAAITDKDKIPEHFNTFFANVGAKLAAQIDTDQHATIEDYLGERNPRSFFLRPTDEHELLNMVKQFTSKSSTDSSGLDMSTVKECFPLITIPFLHICNRSLQTGVFPELLKTAKIVPLFKQGDKGKVSNYRPVSLLPQFSKILEKLYYRRLEEFIDKSGIISGSQYGFRKNSSTSLALIDFVDDITRAIDKHEFTVGIFVDLKKAFDTVNHAILIKKLSHYGVRGVALDWLVSYLNNRTQYVTYNGSNSTSLRVVCGVPQGSILGPLLFLLYINDIVKVSSVMKLILFADDTNVYLSGTDLTQLVNVIQSELVKYESWFKVNKLSLNVSKTNYMIFGNTNQSLSIDVILCGVPITKVEVTKFLGVYIDCKLNWKEHVKILCGKLRKCNAILYKVSAMLDTSTLRMLYCALYLPYLDYCAEIWGNCYYTTLSRVILCQKRVIRTISKSGKLDHTSRLFETHKLLKLTDIVKLKLGVLMFKGLRRELPVNVQSKIQMFSNSRRNMRVCKTEYVRTTCRAKSSLIIGPKLFNNLSKELKGSRSIAMFKRLFKTTVFSTY